MGGIRLNEEKLFCGITIHEYRTRLKRVQEVMTQNGFQVLVIYSDVLRPENCHYLSGYTPMDHNSQYLSVILLSQVGEPILLTGSAAVDVCREVSWIDDVRPIQDMSKALADLQVEARVKKVGVVPHRENLFPVKLYLALKERFESAEIAFHLRLMNDIRHIKSQREIELMEKAYDVGCSGLDQSIKALAEGRSEAELAGAMEYGFRLAGGERGGPTLVCTSRYDRSKHDRPSPKRIVRNGESVSLKPAPKYLGYNSDLSRTAMVGKVPNELIEAYKFCVNLIHWLIDEIKVGRKVSEVAAMAEKRIQESKYANFLQKRKKVSVFGHGLGLDAYDPFHVISVESKDVFEENSTYALHLGFKLKAGEVSFEEPIVVGKSKSRVLAKKSYPDEIYV